VGKAFVLFLGSVCLIFIYLFIYFDMFTQEGGMRIRTNNLRFIRRDLSQLSYLLGDSTFKKKKKKKKFTQNH
jgi:hypothetical protein